MRKFTYILILLILAGGASFYFIFLYNSSTFTNNSAYKAVPIHSPLIIEIQDSHKLIEAFSGGNILINELKKSGILSQLAQELQNIDELRKKDSEFKKISNGKKLILSANFEGKNEVDFLFLISLKDKKEQAAILNIVKETGGQNLISKRIYDNTEIYSASVNNTTFSFAFNKGIFIASKEAILVEEAIRQSNTESLLNNPAFVKLYKTSNSNATANILINHKTIGQLLAKSLTRDIRRRIGFLANYADRSEFDLNLKNDGLFLNGFTFANDSNEKYINLFKDQSPGKTNIENMLPSNTSLFLALNLENPGHFLDNYEEYSKMSGSFYQREADLIKIRKETKTDLLKLTKELATGKCAIAFSSVIQNDPASNRFFLMEIKSQSIATENFENMLNQYIGYKNTDTSTWHTNYQIDNKQKFTFYKFPYPKISETLFGKIFSGISCKYCTFFDNYMVFSDSQAALKEFIHNLVLDETLSKDINYQKFEENVSSRSNLHFYINFSKAFYLNQLYLNEKRTKEWNEYEESIRKFYGLSWQFSNTNDLILNSIYLKFDPAVKEEPQTVWQTKLENNIQTKPQLVLNHNDPNNNEVIFQDQANVLYLVNKEGVTKWKVKLSEAIMSDINQIDYYKNGKYQYLFNTKSHLYLLDRNGENVAGYPISLRSPATNGLAVFDYDNNKNYRLFIACENKKIYAYSKEGKFVNGWNQFVTDNPVQRPIQHIRVENKDYIVCFDRYKTYFLDRRGNIRLNTKASFEHSNNDLILDESGKARLLSTDKDGSIYKLYFDGSFEKTETPGFSANHYFIAADLNNSGQKDFIFADGTQLSAFSEDGKKLFSKKMNKVISEKPDIYSFSTKDKKIGIVLSDENRIYLIDSDGAVYDGFPLHGNTKFSIGILSKGNKFFNLFVGNEDSSFFNYMIE